MTIIVLHDIYVVSQKQPSEYGNLQNETAGLKYIVCNAMRNTHKKVFYYKGDYQQ